ncbi:hypothetical protein [Gordonia sp. MMO-8]|uniref:hypothetical protein n=1 Tax=Gordonia sp. MMO-8 TaxID=3127886 RepID=UPI003016F2AF
MKRKRRANWYAAMCGANYWAAREPQLERAAEHAVGYETDEKDYYARVEPQIMFRQILIDTGLEHRARKEAAA